MKKFISLFLSIIMLLSITAGLDFSAYAAIPSSGKCGTNVSYRYDSNSGTLTISGNGDMKDYTSNDDSPFGYNSVIKKIVINSGVTSIGDRAFCYCNSVTSVSIPNTVTDIGENAFRSCSGLSSISIPNSVKTIGYSAFSRCYGAKTISIGTGVTTIEDDAFECCTGPTSITVPNSVTSIGYSAFFLVNNIVYYGSAEEDYWGHKSLNGYVSGDYVYSDSSKRDLLGCSSLVNSVSIPSSVETIGKNAFWNCNKITTLKIPNSVTEIGQYAFENCSNLVSVSLPNSITTIDKYVFSDCNSLKNITIPSSVTSINWGAFYGCTSLFNFNIPNTVEEIGKYAFANIKNVVYNGLATGSPWAAQAHNGYVESNLVYKDSSKTEICGCSTEATKVVIPKSVKKIYENAFFRCNDIKDVYYTGNQSLWNMIDIESGNASLGFGTMHYNYVPPCDVCKDKKAFVTKATTSKDGRIDYKCATCGKAYKSSVAIPKASSFKLSETSYTYDGKVKTPSVTVKDSKGKTLKKNTDYTVSYSSGRKNVGKYSVKITFKGNYSGTKTLTFKINPKATSLSKLSSAKKGFKATWKKQATQTTGYQIQYSTSSKFSKAKTVTVKGTKTTSKSISKLSAKKTYYVRIRTYKTIGKDNFYSSWSKTLKVKTK